MAKYQNHSLEYVPNGGSWDLRADIAKLYGENIKAENILVFPGGQVALQTAAFACCHKDSHAIVFGPGYQSTVESPMWTGANVTILKRQASNQWQIQLADVQQAIRKNTQYMILNEPYNPGGIVMSQELQQQLVALARQHSITILCDEVYRLLEHTAEDRIPAMADAYENGISAVTMSKPWGGCGITIGWLACPNLEIVQKLIDVQYFGTACVSRASELQGRMVLLASDEILKQRIEIIRHNKRLLQRFIEVDYPEFFEWQRPNAGAIAFVKFKGPWTSEVLGHKLAQRSISMKPAYCFAETVTPDIESYFRVGYGETKMPKALEALRAFVDDHKDEWRAAMKA